MYDIRRYLVLIFIIDIIRELPRILLWNYLRELMKNDFFLFFGVWETRVALVQKS